MILKDSSIPERITKRVIINKKKRSNISEFFFNTIFMNLLQIYLAERKMKK